MRIDVHAHYYPPAYTELLVSMGRQDAAHAGQSTDLSSRLEAMDATGVEVQVLSSVALDVAVADRDDQVRASAFINDIYQVVALAHEGRFRAFGQLPLPYVDESIAEAQRCLDELGFIGINMPPQVGDKPIDRAEFEPLWKELNRRRAIVYIHPVGSDSRHGCGMAEFGLHTAWGSPQQVSVCASRLVYSGLTMRYPNIRFVFAVLGGFLPYWWPRIERNLRRGLSHGADHAVGRQFFSWMQDVGFDPEDPMAEFRRFYYDTSTQDVPEALLCAKNAFGTERILLGSDEIFASLREVIPYIESSPYLSPDEKRAILDENAQTLLQLTPFVTA